MSILLDIGFAVVVLVVLLISVLTLLSENARDELARAYARQVVPQTENDCPAAFGNEFWFACASEVRRINLPGGPPAPPPPAQIADPAPPPPAAAKPATAK